MKKIIVMLLTIAMLLSTCAYATAPDKLVSKLKQSSALPDKAIDVNGDFCVTVDEVHQMFINAVDSFKSDYPNPSTYEGIRIVEEENCFYIITDAWNIPVFEIYCLNSEGEEVNGDSSFTDLCFIFYDDGDFESEVGTGYFLDYVYAIIAVCSEDVKDFGDAIEISSEIIDGLEPEEDGSGLWNGMIDSKSDIYYMSTSQYDDGTSSLYFSVWKDA